MIGVMDHPAREPQYLALKRGKNLELIGFCCRVLEHRRFAFCPDQRLSLATLVFLSGASRTVLQAGGKSESMTGLGGFAGGSGFAICGRSTLSENQWLSSLALQPSSPGTGGCARQFGESAGQRSRTWIWSWWPNQGRTLAIQAPSRVLSSTRHNSFLI